jgi:hypothetical protein
MLSLSQSEEREKSPRSGNAWGLVMYASAAPGGRGQQGARASTAGAAELPLSLVAAALVAALSIVAAAR